MHKQITALFAGAAAVVAGLASSPAKAEPQTVRIEGYVPLKDLAVYLPLNDLAQSVFVVGNDRDQKDLHVDFKTVCFGGGARFLTLSLDHDSGLGNGKGGGKTSFTLRENIPVDLHNVTASIQITWQGYRLDAANIPDISAKSVGFMKANGVFTTYVETEPYNFVRLSGSGSHRTENAKGLILSYVFGFAHSALSYLNVTGTRPLKTEEDHAKIRNQMDLQHQRLQKMAQMSGFLVGEDLCNPKVADLLRRVLELTPSNPQSATQSRVITGNRPVGMD